LSIQGGKGLAPELKKQIYKLLPSRYNWGFRLSKFSLTEF
jgi:hypothetical protein